MKRKAKGAVGVGDGVRIDIEPPMFGTIVADRGNIGIRGRQMLRIDVDGREFDVAAEECVVVRKYA